MMRVLHVFNSNLVAGPEKSVIPGLVEFMKFYPEIQCEILFLEEKRIGDNQAKATEYARSLGLKVQSIEVKSRLDRNAIRQLQQFIVSNQFDIVHAQDVKATVYSRLATKGLPLRLISTFHGFVRKSLKDKFYELVYFYYASQCNDLVTISKDNLQSLKFFATTSRLKLHLIENCIPRPSSKTHNETHQFLLTKKNPLPPKPWGIMPARFAKEKGHRDLFHALKLLPENIDLTVWLFGFGPMEQELMALASELGISHRLVFGGYLDQASDYFSHFDVMFMPSLTEGLPIALLEACWAGLPIIASDIPGIRKVLVNDSFGYFHRANDPQNLFQQIINVMNLNESEKNNKKINLIKHMEEHFSSSSWCEKMKNLYRKA
jgi:glycosyltransferase involved in cell wall biosynthesis